MDTLTTDQARTLCEAIRPMGGYLIRLRDRMIKVGLDIRDPKLFRLVTAADDAVHSLWVELHYESVGHGVGRDPTE